MRAASPHSVLWWSLWWSNSSAVIPQLPLLRFLAGSRQILSFKLGLKTKMTPGLGLDVFTYEEQ